MEWALLGLISILVIVLNERLHKIERDVDKLKETQNE